MVNRDYITCFQFEVYHDDTDFAGVMYHANYLKYMERARTNFLHHYGFSHHILKEEMGCLFVVHRLGVEFLKPCFLEDKVDTYTELLGIKGAVIYFKQRMEIVKNRLQIISSTVDVVSVNCQYRAMLMPKKIRKVFEDVC